MRTFNKSRFDFLLGGGHFVQIYQTKKRASDCFSGDDSDMAARSPKRTAKELPADLDG